MVLKVHDSNPLSELRQKTISFVDRFVTELKARHNTIHAHAGQLRNIVEARKKLRDDTGGAAFPKCAAKPIPAWKQGVEGGYTPSMNHMVPHVNVPDLPAAPAQGRVSTTGDSDWTAATA